MSSNPHQPNKHRRALVQGSLAAPVVQLQRGNQTGWFHFDPALNGDVDLHSPWQPARIGALLEHGREEIGEGKRRALVWVSSRTGTPCSVVRVQQPPGYTASTMSWMMSVKPGGWNAA